MSGRARAAFAAMSVLWGIPYLFFKVAVEDGISPAFLSWARVVVAAVLLLSGGLPQRQLRARSRV